VTTPSETAAHLLAEFSSGTHKAFDDFTVSVAALPPLIPEGEYDAVVVSCRRDWQFKRPCLAFGFLICSEGAAFGTKLEAFVNLQHVSNKKIQKGSRANLAKWLRRINAFDPTVSVQQLHLPIFARYQFRVLVKTTTMDSNQNVLPVSEHYSKVVDLIEVVGYLKRNRNAG
jgi:hypothetical protein